MLCNVASLQLCQEQLKAAPLSVSTRGTLQTQLHPLHSSLAHSGRPSPPHQRPMQHRQRHHFDTPTYCDGTRSVVTIIPSVPQMLSRCVSVCPRECEIE